MEEYHTSEQRSGCVFIPSPTVEHTELAFYYIALILISIFVIEIFLALYGYGWRRYKKFLYFLDAIIVLASFLMEVYFHFGHIGRAGRAAAGLVVLRLWKIIRALHAIAHSMALRNHMIVTEIEKARQALSEEKLQTEETIEQQNTYMNHLLNILNSRNRSNSVIATRF